MHSTGELRADFQGDTFGATRKFESYLAIFEAEKKTSLRRIEAEGNILRAGTAILANANVNLERKDAYFLPRFCPYPSFVPESYSLLLEMLYARSHSFALLYLSAWAIGRHRATKKWLYFRATKISLYSSVSDRFHVFLDIKMLNMPAMVLHGKDLKDQQDKTLATLALAYGRWFYFNPGTTVSTSLKSELLRSKTLLKAKYLIRWALNLQGFCLETACKKCLTLLKESWTKAEDVKPVLDWTLGILNVKISFF